MPNGDERACRARLPGIHKIVRGSAARRRRVSPKSMAHLHVHTEYSMLDGAARIRELVDKPSSSDAGTAVTITERSTASSTSTKRVMTQDQADLDVSSPARAPPFLEGPSDDQPEDHPATSPSSEEQTGYRTVLSSRRPLPRGDYYKAPRHGAARRACRRSDRTRCLNGQVRACCSKRA